MTSLDDRPAGPAARKQHQFTGRRVRVRDLLDAGLIEAGAALRFERPDVAEGLRATVTESGRLRLDDGQEFRSLSGAAAELTGNRMDGWHAWMTGSPLRTMDDLRRQLLDDASAGTDEDGEQIAAEPAMGDDERWRHELLREARRAADGGTPRTLRVRELLELWGARRRDSAVNDRIATDLANHGLVTEPDFRAVTLDHEIVLGLPACTDPMKTREPMLPLQSTDDDDPLPEPGLTVGNLPQAMAGVESVPPTATLEQAVTTMLVHDFSQLAVMSDARTVKGAVSWKSMAKARNAQPNASLAAALVKATEVPYTMPIIEALRVLQQEDFVLVRGADGAISGIVTATDVVAAYGEVATPFFLIGEIDHTMRRLIELSFPLERVAAMVDPARIRGIDAYGRLSMDDYARIIEAPGAWEDLGWSLDRGVFMARLREIVEIRDMVMHFNPDPLPERGIGMLRHFLDMLREYAK